MLPSHPDDIIEQIESIEIKTKIRKLLDDTVGKLVTPSNTIDPHITNKLWNDYYNYIYKFDRKPELINRWAKWLLIRTNVFYEKIAEETSTTHKVSGDITTEIAETLLVRFVNIASDISLVRINTHYNHEYDNVVIDDLSKVMTLIALSEMSPEDRVFIDICGVMIDIDDFCSRYKFLKQNTAEDDLTTYVYIRSSLHRLIYYLNKTIY
jgi:hypothetical protein